VSGAILLYLAEKSGRLLPVDPVTRQSAIAWLFWHVANQGPMLGQATHFVSQRKRKAFMFPMQSSGLQGKWRARLFHHTV
jgi:GST-like protein